MPDVPAPPLPELIQRYLAGESITTLAQEYRSCRQTLYNWMLGETGEAYAALITRALINRIAEADDALECAASKIDVARAREITRYARMDFERRRPQLYGPKQEISTDEKITIVVQRNNTSTPSVAGPTSQPVDILPNQIMQITENVDKSTG